MGSDDQQKQLEYAFDRIEGTILPCIRMMLDTLLDASELGGTGVTPQAYAAELRTLALELEALNRDIDTFSPARLDAGSYRSVGVGRR